MKFTDKELAALILPEGRKDRLVFDTECRNLGVRVTAKSKTFIAQWTDPATKRKVREPLGVWGNITIAQARDAARARAGDVAKGINPKAERDQQRKRADQERAELALTFEKLVDDWEALRLAKMRQRYRVEAVRAIKHTLAHLLKRPAARITKADAVTALDALVKAGKPGMAAKTHAYARAAYRWAEQRGAISINPFQGLPDPPRTESRDRVLDDTELAEIWAAAGALAYPWGSFFQIGLLTLQRREEVAGMRWSELGDLDNQTWRIDAKRMKNGKPHVVHLSNDAVTILREIPRIEGCDFVFSTTGKTHISGYSKAKGALDAAIVEARADQEKLAGWWLHDFRRTGVSKLAGLGFDSITVDKILAHQPAKLSGTARIYQQHEFLKERAQALDAWAAHVTGQPVDNVVQLQKRA
jgi:integrase